jgi:hypothetical protein
MTTYFGLAPAHIVSELAESSAVALALLEALDTEGWQADDVRTLEGIIGRLRRAHRAYTT